MKFLFDQDVPHDLAHGLFQLGHDVTHLREVLPVTSEDSAILRFAAAGGYIMVTCNRDDFISLTGSIAHAGIIIVIRRKTRAAERSAFIQLLDRAGESGIAGNINIA